jgi:hypothetical protein
MIRAPLPEQTCGAAGGLTFDFTSFFAGAGTDVVVLALLVSTGTDGLLFTSS